MSLVTFTVAALSMIESAVAQISTSQADLDAFPNFAEAIVLGGFAG